MKDWLQVAEPELLRFMFISYQQNTAIDFDMESNKLFLLADRYDNAENAFFGKKSDDKRTNQMKREYELSQVLKPKKLGTDMDYAFATVVTQLIGNDVENALTLLRKTGHIKGKLNKKSEERIAKRLWLAQNWVERFAPAEKRITINEKPQVKLDVKQKNAVRMLVDILSVKRSQDELYSKFFDISKSMDISSTLFFKTVYQILISKDSGPRLAPFILAIGQQRARKILEKVL
jgi:lysyl-tRNA synthetase class 1